MTFYGVRQVASKVHMENKHARILREHWKRKTVRGNWPYLKVLYHKFSDLNTVVLAHEQSKRQMEKNRNIYENLVYDKMHLKLLEPRWSF
jgi:hypothetical protein